MQISRIMAALFFAALAACGVLALHFRLSTWNSHFWRELKNFGHAPLFGFIALCLFAMLINMPGIRSRRRTTIYLLALAAALLLATASELAQLHGPRDADPWDAARDMTGAIFTLAMLATFDRKLLGQEPWRRKRFRWMVRIGAVTLLLVAFMPVAILMESYRRRSVQMPMLVGFHSRWDLPFVQNNGAELHLAPPPSGWEGMEQRLVGKADFSPGRWPGLVFLEPSPDWTPYTYFSLELYSEHDSPIDIVLRIDDEYANDFYWDRFNRRVTLQPGANQIRFPLEELRASPRTRKMDLSAIRVIVLFAVGPEEPFTLYLADMELE